MYSFNEIQWRNIKKVVKGLADFCFGSPNDPRYGHYHVMLTTSLTAKDGMDISTLNLEPFVSVDCAKKEGFLLGYAAVCRIKNNVNCLTGYIVHKSKIVNSKRDADLIIEQWLTQGFTTDLFEYDSIPVYTDESNAHIEIQRLRAENAELQIKADRYDWLDQNAIMWKPPGYDGCKRGRFDAYWYSEDEDLAYHIDSQLKKERK
ncbi:MAG TPA: hypothetical protein VFM18_12730 [Methanosarcina sp.]|nr:hypothetical protein [Methanosarcina sp.]